MEKYEVTLRNRIRLSYVLIVFLLAVMVLVGELSGKLLLDSRTMTPAASRISSALFFGTLILLIVRIVRTKSLLRHRLYRKEREILENDERRQWIHSHSSARAFDTLIVLLTAAVFALAYIDMAAFYTAWSIWCAAGLLKLFLHLYYSKHF